ncbi:glycine--tRNA ligase subunit beta [Temperatibacter marinus]|uniref:Glycine--tRNA ligase beta subunit n=1 Tax=Temperatibacter marinus TaxID=1456591 RepID=A0AA52EL17_9PROT|nr:glycine--tRNA ligase subunit beta [Temperatibacter marinus]WND03971.1 glycine--tRNA ligase subunit beta [Temperatibacter marinus]
MTQELLIELFSEEIPARMQQKAGEDFRRLMADELKAAGLTFGAMDAFTTPRRLTLVVRDLPAQTPDTREERKGPATAAPEKAVEGFLRGAGVTRDDCEIREVKGREFLFAIIEKKGVQTTEVIAAALTKIIRNFPWPKSQRWGAGNLRWVRPLQNILCLYGGTAVELSLDELTSSTKTFGHRFLAPEWFDVADFADYEAKLLAHKVMLRPSDRAAMIAEAAESLASDTGLTWVEDKGLLQEVSGLVEWPVPLMGSFDPAFLDVPEEVLILTMKKDQKYFVLRDMKGQLAPHFITISNLEATDGGTAIAEGNARVIAARLADAKFFWEQDLKGRLDDLLPALKEIIFHIDLGTVHERVERMKAVASSLAERCGADASDAVRAAELSKADLTSNMVYEFPEVQGVMGRYYAQKQGESEAVADALRDHYAPAGPSDDCPSAPVSIAVALAEKLDTLVGFFGIEQKPTGSKDPYALRRAALGVIRLITENDIRLNLAPSFEAVKCEFSCDLAPLDDLLAFFMDRLKVQQKEKGVRFDVIDAVAALGGDDLVDILNRVNALQSFLATEDGSNLVAGYKRANNILKKAAAENGLAGQGTTEAEAALYDALEAAATPVASSLDSEDYAAVMSALASLRGPIDQFFEDVMVNSEVDSERQNRLALLASFVANVNKVADFTQLEG